MLLWFATLAAAGIYQIVQNPSVLRAINPYYGLYFATHHGWAGFVSLGAVVLAVTGAEALYADMGHFGRDPINKTWLWFVFPSLVLNYFGQGAMVLLDCYQSTGTVPVDVQRGGSAVRVACALAKCQAGVLQVARAAAPATMLFTLWPDANSAPPHETWMMPSHSASAKPRIAATIVWDEVQLMAG